MNTIRDGISKEALDNYVAGLKVKYPRLFATKEIADTFVAAMTDTLQSAKDVLMAASGGRYIEELGAFAESDLKHIKKNIYPLTENEKEEIASDPEKAVLKLLTTAYEMCIGVLFRVSQGETFLEAHSHQAANTAIGTHGGDHLEGTRDKGEVLLSSDIPDEELDVLMSRGVKGQA